MVLNILINQVSFKWCKKTADPRVKIFSTQLTKSRTPDLDLESNRGRTSSPASQMLTKTVSIKTRQSPSFLITCLTSQQWLGHVVVSLKQTTEVSLIFKVQVVALVMLSTKISLINPYLNSINSVRDKPQVPTSKMPIISQTTKASRVVLAQATLS